MVWMNWVFVCKFFITEENPNKGRIHFLRNESNKGLFQNYFLSRSNSWLFDENSVQNAIFVSLIVPKGVCKSDFQAYLLALSDDQCNFDLFLGLFYQNLDSNKVLFKSPLFVIFRFRAK